MGQLWEYVKMALANIRMNRGRSFLTMLGIIIGVSSVILIMSVGNGARLEMEQELTAVAGGQIYIYANSNLEEVPVITEADREAIRMLDGGTGINYEQLIADLILSWRTNPRDEEEAWLMKDFSATEERNVIFDYFRPDKLTEKETKVWKKVREYLKEQFIKNTTNNDTTLAFF